MARTNLDLDTLRSLSVVHDLGGMAQAADQLGRTPSAISLQMRRLQDELGTVLFRRRGRGLALTEAGEIALRYARRILLLNDELIDTMQGAKLAGTIRVGCAQDFASLLPAALARFAELYPRMQVELSVEGNAALADAVDKSRIDVALVVGHQERAAARIVGELELVWIASSRFTLQEGEPLPLAVLGPQCAFRRCAIERLEAAQLSYRIAANSPSLDGLWAAVLGGLGITARTALNLPGGLQWAPILHKLPSLGRMPVTLHKSACSKGAAAEAMEALLMAALQAQLPVQRPKAKAPEGVGRASKRRREA